MLKAEWIRIKTKKSLYVLPLIPMICVFFIIYRHYRLAMEFHQMKPSPDNPFAGAPLDELLYWLKSDSIFIYTLNDMVQTVYFFPLVLVGVIWVYDDLKNGTLPRIAVLHRDRLRYFTYKIVSMSLYFVVILVLYFIIFSLSVMAIPHIPTGNWPQVVLQNIVRSFPIYLSTFIFWGVVGMMVTYVFNSAIAGAGITMFYLLFERIFTSQIATTLQSTLLMTLSEYLPWANFHSLFVYAAGTEHWTNFGESVKFTISPTQPGMFRLEEVSTGITVPVPFLKPFPILVGVIVIYFIIVVYVFWKSFQYRISKS